MRVTCICVCHNKPDITQEAIQSILNQSYSHWEAIVVDSGVLYDAGFYDQLRWRHDPRVQLIRSTETEETRRTKAMAPWCFNQCFRQGLVSGDLIVYLCDDDILYPNAFATFVSYCRENPHAQAMYASQDVAVIYPNGWRAIVGERRATLPGGRACQGRRMDCHVDYLQFCHKAVVLRALPNHEYWPEGKDSESHADGIFMERVGAYTTIYPIDVKVSQNRRTLRSTYAPVPPFTLIECMANGIPFLTSQAGERPKVGAERVPPEGTLTTGTGKRADGKTSDLESDPLVTISIAVWNQVSSLAATLASVARQTYAHLEVLVIDHGSPDDESGKVFEAMKSRYPQCRFLHPSQSGSDVTRDHGLWEAHGVYFIPMDAGTLACPDMVECLVAGMRRNPALSALTCYVLALGQAHDLSTEELCHLASTKNICGSGIFHVANLRDVGGFGTDLETSSQDWIGFLKLINSGYQVDLVPEHLFYYPPLEDRSLEGREDSLEPERVLRPFFEVDRQLAAEKVALWTAFAGMHRRLEQLTEQNQAMQRQNQALQTRCASLRYQVADRLTMLCARVPLAKQSIRWLLCRNRQNEKGPL
jgi:hypothetical protein